MKLGGRCTVQKSQRSSNLGVIDPPGAHPQNVALGYDIGEISTGCLVSYAYITTAHLKFLLQYDEDVRLMFTVQCTCTVQIHFISFDLKCRNCHWIYRLQFPIRQEYFRHWKISSVVFIGNICNIYISSLFDPIVTFEVNMTIHYTVMMFSLLAGYVALWLWPSDLKHLPPIMCHVINPGTNCELSKAIHSRGVMAHTYCSWQYE